MDYVQIITQIRVHCCREKILKKYEIYAIYNKIVLMKLILGCNEQLANLIGAEIRYKVLFMIILEFRKAIQLIITFQD